MNFEQNKQFIKIGEKVGFVLAYFFFTTSLFIILTLLDKIPSTWTYFHIMIITSLILVLGYVTKKMLK